MRAYVGVGTNLGDRWAQLALSARSLRAVPRITVARASRVYDNVPIGPPQPRYLNAVLELETELAAFELLGVLQDVERQCGRVPNVRWGARCLDLDLLLLGDEVVRRPPELVVPHPAIVARRFVLQPLADLCPDRVVPGLGKTVRELLAAAPPHDIECAGLYPL
jgi:2-amino-4-hydroxy-6-hydroxymethyldihydropteridine diphosphokinase